MPPTATHESVKQQFKEFGDVAYVSLPKFRMSGRIKEFAFVEFDEKSSVERCIDAFRLFNGVIGDAQDAENLASVVSYVKEQEEIENKDEEKPDEDSDDNKPDLKVEDESGAKVDMKVEIGIKRSKEEPENSDSEDVVPTKRMKTEESEANIDANADAEHEADIKNESDPENDTNDNTDEKTSVTDENQEQKKKK